MMSILMLILAKAAFAAELDGIWAGSYAYPGSSEPEVRFSLSLCQEGTKIKGETIEPNTFGDKSSNVLRAKVNGEAGEAKIQFVKTYDGSGGVSHSVSYSGVIQDQKIRGTWKIGQQGQGTFEISRVSPAGLESACNHQVMPERPSDITGAQ